MKLYNRCNSRRPLIIIELFVKALVNASKKTILGKCWHHYIETIINSSVALDISKVIVNDNERYLTSMAIILRSATDNKKGVLLIKYSYAFPLFLYMFDVSKVMSRYHVILEPSWTGYCDGTILCFANMPSKVFVQSLEPKDSDFLLNVTKNIIPIPIGSNWWVDHRVFRPRPDIVKDIDLCVNASWAKFKCHEEIFAAVSKIKQGSRLIKLLLIGYPIGEMTSDDILALAKKYGIEDQVEIQEKIPSEKVAENMARCKANIVWSKKEGVNRSIIEGFLCDVPGILREGFNFGHKYEYINEATGTFASQSNLVEVLVQVIDNYQMYGSRNWVLNHMTCQHASAVLENALIPYERGPIDIASGKIDSKINTLDKMLYFNDCSYQKFKSDYEYMRTCIKVHKK